MKGKESTRCPHENARATPDNFAPRSLCAHACLTSPNTKPFAFDIAQRKRGNEATRSLKEVNVSVTFQIGKTARARSATITSEIGKSGVVQIWTSCNLSVSVMTSFTSSAIIRVIITLFAVQGGSF